MKLAAAIEKRLEAVAARVEASTAAVPDFVDATFPVQTAFITDASPLIAALCTRRAAKSFSAGKRLLRAAYKYPGSSSLFIGLTRISAKKIVWKDVLKVLNKKMALGVVFNETELTATLPNGSIIYILGVDTTDEEREKLLGQKYAEVCIDESASYSIDLHSLVYDVLKPAVADYRGTITMVGTPGNLKSGIFFELTEGQDPTTPGRWSKLGWSCHRWSTLDNPYMRENWLAEIAQLIADNPRIEETPGFQQNYRGRWTIDESKLVYRYQMGRNDFDGTLPVFTRGEWHCVLAIDLGFNDATSFTVDAYHDHSRVLYVLESYKKSGLDLTLVARECDALKAKYNVESTVIDGSAKQAVAELNNRLGLDAVPAEKQGKAEFIDIMNDELLQGRILLSPDCQPLKDEYAGLIWDERALTRKPPKRIEHPGCENHCADGGLYGWRFCYQYISEPLKDVPPQKSAEYYAHVQREEIRALEATFEREMAQNQRNTTSEASDLEWL